MESPTVLCCPSCGSLKVVHNGKRYYNGSVIQRYSCGDCELRFSDTRAISQTIVDFQNIEEYKTPVPSVPSLSTNINALKSQNEKNKEAENCGTVGTVGTKKPIYYVKSILSAEKCDGCGLFAVTKEIVTPQSDKIRCCEECTKKLRSTFSKAVWKLAYPDLAEYREGRP